MLSRGRVTWPDCIGTPPRCCPTRHSLYPTPSACHYLDQFLDYATLRPKDRIGLHIYQGTPWTAVHTWPDAWLRQAEDILARHGIENPYWISEVGVSEKWPMATATRYATEILSSNAEVICLQPPAAVGCLAADGIYMRLAAH